MQEIEINFEVDPERLSSVWEKDSTLQRAGEELKKWLVSEEERIEKAKARTAVHWEEVKELTKEIRKLKSRQYTAREKAYADQRAARRRAAPPGLHNRISSRKRLLKDKLLQTFLREQSDKFHQKFDELITSNESDTS
jgi:septal ring factor EnvC (AmiA/AmiB activator)